MDLTIQFPFRNKLYSCIVYMDIADDPCYVFIMLSDKELVKEFGEDVTLKTDCVRLLDKTDDYPELVNLRQAIFDVVKTTPEFTVAKDKRMRWNELQKIVYKQGYILKHLN